MRLLELNEDIICRIVHHLPRICDAVALAKTSRYADHMTIPRRLSVVAGLTGPRNVRSFCAFCLADRESRPRHILELQLDVVDTKAQDFHVICEVILLAVNLRSLSLEGLIGVDSSYAALSAMLGNKTTISTLLIGLTSCDMYAKPDISKLLLHTAHLSLITHLEFYWWYPGADTWAMLASLYKTLRTFRAHRVYPCYDMASSPEPPESLACSDVHTLHLSPAFAPWLACFTQFFPNVRTLRWEARNWNKPSVAPKTYATAHWPLLDHLAYDHAFYPPLSASTRTRRVDVRYSAQDEVPTSLLKEIAPVVLMCTSSIAPFIGDTPPLPEDGSRLRYLSHTQRRVTKEGPTMAEVLSRAEAYSNACAVLPGLLGLSLNFDVDCEGESESSCYTALANAARAVASHLSILQFVCIRGRHKDKDITGWFKVTAHAEGGEIVQRLPWWEEDAVEARLLALAA